MKPTTMRNAYCAVLLVILVMGVLLSPLFPTVARAADTLELRVGDRNQLFSSLHGASWLSSDRFVASVTDTGKVEAKGVGIAEIKARVDGKEQRRTLLVRAPKGTPTYPSRDSLHRALLQAAAEYKERYTFQFTIKNLPLQDELAEKAIMAYFPNSEEFFAAYCRELHFSFVWVNGSASESLVEATCTFKYASAAEVAASYQGQSPTLSSDAQVLKARCDEIIQELGLRSMKTRYERVLAVHDYIVKNARYDETALNKSNRYPDSYTAFGVLVEGKGVCQSYAEAMKLLLNAVGVACDYVVGYTYENHAWNRVQLDDGNWYNVDATWDDPLPDVEGSADHSYFCVTDQKLRKTHTWTDTRNRCTSTEYSYDKIAALLKRP